ncbi:hypothetical protein [Devosia sp. DBB001]|nr:hypothetical protein [Devosia sp. DBB001]
MAFDKQAPEWVARRTSEIVVAMADADYPAYVMLMGELEGLANHESLNGRSESCRGILSTMQAMKAKYRDDLLAEHEAASPFSRENWSKLTPDQKAGRAPLPDFSALPFEHDEAA